MPDLTFLMNRDPSGSTNPFYGLAKQFFAGTTVIDPPPDKSQTLEGVFAKLKTLNQKQGTINLVSHAVGFGAMDGVLTLALQSKGRSMILADDMQDALAAKSLPPPGPAIVTRDTRVVIYGCDVGRSENFLKLLSSLFGDPGELLAPRRMCVFKSVGTTVQYRQARSWSLARKPPDLLAGSAPASGTWPAYRAKFVEDADRKFGRVAVTDDAVGGQTVKDLLTGAAKTATTAMGATFFLQETINIFPDGTQTAEEAAQSIRPMSNGDPPTALPKKAVDVDDSSVVMTVGPDDTFAVNTARTQFAIAIVVLGQVIDEEVLIAEGPGYRRVTTAPPLAPSTGPRPAGGGGGSGAGSGGGSGASAFNDQLRMLLDEVIADGAAQADVDALLAEVPQGDATEGLATDAPDVPPEDDPESSSSPPEEPA